MSKEEYLQLKKECDQMCDCPILRLGKVVVAILGALAFGAILYYGVVLGGFNSGWGF